MRSIFAGVGAVVLATTWLGWEVAQWVTSPKHYDEQARYREMTNSDPRNGSPPPDGLRSRSKSVALVWLGDCSSCTMRALNIKDLEASGPAGTELILATGTKPNSPRQPLGLRTVRLSEDAQKKLNTFFAPRVYVYHEGRLVAVQMTGQDPKDLLGNAQ